MKLNKEELTIGFIFGISFWPILGLFSVLLALATSYLWALSGAEGHDKIWRRVGVPFLACLAVFIVRHSWHIWVSLPLAYAVLSLGYGIPDSGDKGSWLGQKWFNINPEYAWLFTRLTIYILLAISFLIGIFL